MLSPALAIAFLSLSSPVASGPVAQDLPRVMIDAGHGALHNPGETSSCQLEQEFTKQTQDAVLALLQDAGGLALKAGRPTASLVAYGDRLQAMNAWHADAVISIHSDARAADGWTHDEHQDCWHSRGGTGFAVLFSDEGDAALVSKRKALATALAHEMIEAGFSAYDGVDYPGLYALVSDGVFVDRHPDRQRIMMLRSSRVPLVIVETHQALDDAEAARWRDPAAQRAFATAIQRAVLALHPSPTTR
ncbi:MAG TPA: N-acetylmuramoyl-L-alanine amidase [Myxococcota bacterium]|jgi:N-acetylmuramoyl-L-alanine amidase